MPEYSSEGRRVDYALCAYPARPSAFIEAKAIGKVEAADRQLFEYAFHEGVPFAILTDGLTWSFYLPSAQVSYEDRRLYKLDLQERSANECELIFNRYLSWQRLRSGEAQSDAQKDYASRSNERMATETLGRAWTELLNEPDPLLIELLVERAEALCGIKPSLEAAEAFLLAKPTFLAAVQQPPIKPYAQSARSSASTPTPFASLGGSTPAPAPNTTAVVTQAKVFASFRGRPIAVRDATAGFLELLRSLATEFPEKMPRIAAVAKGRSRNHIASVAGQVYPERPDLIGRVVELVPG